MERAEQKTTKSTLGMFFETGIRLEILSTTRRLEALGIIERKTTQGDDFFRWSPIFKGS